MLRFGWKLVIVVSLAAILQACTLPTARPVAPPPTSEASAPPAVPASEGPSTADVRPAEQIPALPVPPSMPETSTADSKAVVEERAAAPVVAPTAPALPAKVAATAPSVPKPAAPGAAVPAKTPAAEPAVAPAPLPSPVAVPAIPPSPVAIAPTPAPVQLNETPTSFDVRGTIELEAGSGATVEAAEVADVLLYFVPDGGAPKPAPAKSQVATRNKRFEPATLIITAGSTVAFPNQDVVLHNAFSLTPSTPFDLGIYGPGQSREVTFTRPGIVRVHCNVHHSMQTDVLVVDTPYFARADASGKFLMKGVPAGSGKLFLWHPRASLESRPLKLPAAKDLRLSLVATKPRVPPHGNKDGQSYRADAAR